MQIEQCLIEYIHNNPIEHGSTPKSCIFGHGIFWSHLRKI